MSREVRYNQLLTKQEEIVLGLMRFGDTIRQIAKKLDIQEMLVKSYRANIIKKLELPDEVNDYAVVETAKFKKIWNR